MSQEPSDRELRKQAEKNLEEMLAREAARKALFGGADTPPITATGNEHFRTVNPFDGVSSGVAGKGGAIPDPQVPMEKLAESVRKAFPPGQPSSAQRPKDDLHGDVKRAYDQVMGKRDDAAGELHADDKAIMLGIGLASFGSGLIGYFESYPWLGTFFVVGGLIVIAPASHFVRTKIKWLSGRTALWAFAAMTWLFLAANLGWLIFKQPALEHQFTIADLKQLQQVVGKNFHNEVVVIDGKWFINCTFENVTFEYDGGFGKIENPTYKGSMSFKTNSGAVGGALSLFKGLGLLKPDFAAIWDENPALPK